MRLNLIKSEKKTLSDVRSLRNLENIFNFFELGGAKSDSTQWLLFENNHFYDFLILRYLDCICFIDLINYKKYKNYISEF